MTKLVNLLIDEQSVSVPEGTLVVNAAKQVGVDIPVFCYHPKMEPVGMCRMCLVEIGRPVIDRATSESTLSPKPVLEADGSPKIQFSPKLETACTTPVSEGMVVLGMTDKVKEGREDILEFLLTSHPLDCPVCDKGGECPLQNLTMGFGPGQSRYIYAEKMHLAKHVPLGELIYLDRERCIQCGRCVRFQDEIVDDPVIRFYHRGRALEIVTFTEPGFDSYFSGNTTDICPVGALTTADFRFKARPWELKAAASICTQCPVGCNLTFNVRREAVSGGDWVIKRAMPRQNEWVNEIWICDKGRFGYHYANVNGMSGDLDRRHPGDLDRRHPGGLDRRHPGGLDRRHPVKGAFYSGAPYHQRLKQPLMRKGGELVPVAWEEALEAVAQHFKEAGKDLLTLAGGRLSNEDLFNLRQLTTALEGQTALYSTMAGGDLVAQVGFGQGTNFSEMGPETAILVVACDLEEEAPIWRLRVKQAAERGAKLIVLNPRPTKADRSAAYIIRYPYGAEATTVLAMLNALSAKRPNLTDPVFGRSLECTGCIQPHHSTPASTDAVQGLRQMGTFERSPELQAAVKVFAEAQNAVILFGSEGTSLEASQALANACANLLVVTNHVGRSNNGLLGVWQRANDQGAWDMGFRPLSVDGMSGDRAVFARLDRRHPASLKAAMQAAKALYVAAADPAGDDPSLAEAAEFLVVQELFLTPTARLADVVLPVAAFTEREGSFTSGERRVQRFYPAVPGPAGLSADFAVTGQIGQRLGLNLESRLASKVMDRIAAQIPDYSGLSYAKLSEVVEQWPIIGRGDVSYGGTTYENSQGIGFQLAPRCSLPTTAERGAAFTLAWVQPPELKLPNGSLLAAPVTRLYDRGQTLLPSKLLHLRLPEPYVVLNPEDAHRRLGVAEGSKVEVHLNGVITLVNARLDQAAPAGVVLVPRNLGLPVWGLTAIDIRTVDGKV